MRRSWSTRSARAADADVDRTDGAAEVRVVHVGEVALVGAVQAQQRRAEAGRGGQHPAGGRGASRGAGTRRADRREQRGGGDGAERRAGESHAGHGS